MPYLGVVDAAAREAAFATRIRRIGVIGTAATIRSRSYETLLRQLVPGVEITPQACPLFVPLVENGYVDGSAPEKQQVSRLVIAQYLEPVRRAGVDTLILGCTHYPLLQEMIGDYMGREVALVDPAKAAAHHLERLLLSGACGPDGRPGRHIFMSAMCRMVLSRPQTCFWASTGAALWSRSPSANIELCGGSACFPHSVVKIATKRIVEP